MGLVELKVREWRPDSWRMLPAAQMPAYPDLDALAAVEDGLGTAAAIASIADSTQLSADIAQAAAGEAFILQGGDCAESFGESSAASVTETVDLFNEMSRRITEGIGVPVV